MPDHNELQLALISWPQKDWRLVYGGVHFESYVTDVMTSLAAERREAAAALNQSCGLSE